MADPLHALVTRPYDPSYAVEAVIKAMEPPVPVSLAAVRAAKAAYDKRYPKGPVK